MNGIDVHALPPGQRGEVFYPDSDGKPMAETEVHLDLMLNVIGALRDYFSPRPDVYVVGDMFLYYREGHPEARRAPDVMVVKGVETKGKRRSFKTWEEKALPCVVLEFTSEETAKEDQEEKKPLYQQLGVREYFLYDPLHDYLPQQLMGYRLIRGEYEPLIPAADGSLLSLELGLLLRPAGPDLALIEFKTGKRLPPPAELARLNQELTERARQAQEEIKEERRQAQTEIAEARQQARQAQESATRAEQEARQARAQATLADERIKQTEEQRQQERKQIEALQAELARLRSQLPQPPSA